MNRVTVLIAIAGVVACAGAFGQGKTVCPVDRKAVANPAKATRVVINGRRNYFCGPKCVAAFRKNPEKYVTPAIAGDCPILGTPVADIIPDHRRVVNNNLYYLCCEGCANSIATSFTHLKRQPDPVTGEVFEVNSNSPRLDYQGQHYFFALDDNKKAFEKNPGKYAVVFGK